MTRKIRSVVQSSFGPWQHFAFALYSTPHRLTPTASSIRINISGWIPAQFQNVTTMTLLPPTRSVSCKELIHPAKDRPKIPYASEHREDATPMAIRA